MFEYETSHPQAQIGFHVSEWVPDFVRPCGIDNNGWLVTVDLGHLLRFLRCLIGPQIVEVLKGILEGGVPMRLVILSRTLRLGDVDPSNAVPRDPKAEAGSVVVILAIKSGHSHFSSGGKESLRRQFLQVGTLY